MQSLELDFDSVIVTKEKVLTLTLPINPKLNKYKQLTFPMVKALDRQKADFYEEIKKL